MFVGAKFISPATINRLIYLPVAPLTRRSGAINHAPTSMMIIVARATNL
jgi:hypothetical protein